MEELTCRRCDNTFKHHSTKKRFCGKCCQQKKKEFNQRAFQNKKRKVAEQSPDLDLVPSTTNLIKNENNGTESVPFLKECRIIESDNAELILFDVCSEMKKSESLSDWNTLVHTYGEYEGDVFEYKPHEDENSKKWMNTGSNCKMKLNEWNLWFQTEQKKPIEERKCLYITGISLSSSDVDYLRENTLVNAFAYCGQLDLTNYILKVCRDSPIPRMDFIFLISPPWGHIMTFPHMDGFGSQLSTHCFLLGHGENLIHLWPKFDETESYYFRKVLSLPSLTEDQQQPHDRQHDVDSNGHVWDEKLERQLNDYGIYSKSIKIKPGQAVILPQGKYHCFKKICRNEPTQNGDMIPLVSCACDASYVGVDNFIDNYYTIMRCHQLHKIKYSLYELGLLCLLKLCQSAPLDSNTIMFHHAKEALPIFTRWLEEQNVLLNQLGGEIQIVSDVHKMEKELECDKCDMPISNFFIPSKKKYVCLKCGKQQQKGNRGSIQVHYRLFDIATAERIINKINSKINGGMISTASVPNLHSDDVEIIGSDVTGCSTDDSGKLVKKRKLNGNTSTQIVTNNNNHNNNSRRDLDQEIEQFLPLVKGILEGRIITDRSTLWNQSTAQERRMFRHQNRYGGFDDEELDYIFNALVLRLLLESSSPIACQPHQLVAYILDVVWPELGAELLKHRLGTTREEANKILDTDSHYQSSRIEAMFQYQ